MSFILNVMQIINYVFNGKGKTVFKIDENENFQLSVQVDIAQEGEYIGVPSYMDTCPQWKENAEKWKRE